MEAQSSNQTFKLDHLFNVKGKGMWTVVLLNTKDQRY